MHTRTFMHDHLLILLDQDKKEADDGIIYAAELSDEPTLESLRKAYNSDFDKVINIYSCRQKINITLGIFNLRYKYCYSNLRTL